MKDLIESQQGKARLYFAQTLFINLSILSVLVTGIMIGVKGYISNTKFTYETVTCCGSICSKCFFTFHTFFTVLPWVCIVMFLIGIYRAIHKAFFMLSRNHRCIRSFTPLPIENHRKLKKILPSIHLDSQLVLLDNNNLSYAFTSGLWKPKIYLSTGICSYLTTKELLAVILHEIDHKRNRAPLKLFVIQIIQALNFFLPINPYLLNLYSSASEKAADDTAVNTSGESLALASALVKLSKPSMMTMLCPSVAFSIGQSVVEDRIRRLLEPQVVPPCFRKKYVYLSFLLSLFIALTICFSLFYKPFIYAHASGCKIRSCHMLVCG